MKTMRKTIMFLLCAVCAVCLACGVAACGGKDGPEDDKEIVMQGTQDGVLYEVTEDRTEVRVTGVNEYLGDNVVLLSSFSSLPVTEIGAGAFAGTEITSLVIPDSVERIGERAFAGCSALRSLTIGRGVKTFGDEAFAGCVSLRSVIYYAEEADGLASGNGVFSDAGRESSGINVYFEGGVRAVPSYLFDPDDGESSPYVTEIEYEASCAMESIGACAFAYCSSLESVEILPTVAEIGDGAFLGCSQLSAAYLAEGLARVGDYAFCGCPLRGALSIPSTVTEIGAYAFCGCDSLTSLCVGESVASMGEYAFAYCASLTEIVFAAEDCADLSAHNGVFAYAGRGADGITFTIEKNVGRVPAYLLNPGDEASEPNVTTICYEAVMADDLTADSRVFFDREYEDETGDGGDDNDDDGGAEDDDDGGDGGDEGGGIAPLALSYADDGFEGMRVEIRIGASVERVPAYLFACADIECVYLPEGAACPSFGEGVFEGANVSAVGGDLFSWFAAAYEGEGSTPFASARGWLSDGSLTTEISIPEGVTAVPARMFAGAAFLTALTVPSTVSRMGADAFAGCPSLKFLYADMAAWCGTEFENAEANPLSNASCAMYNAAGTKLQTFDVPEGVTVIRSYCFYGCDILAVRFPTTLTEVEHDAFLGATCSLGIGVYIKDVAAWCAVVFDCASDNPMSLGATLYLNNHPMTSLEIPEGVTRVSDFVFCGCTSVSSVSLPSTLKAVGDHAFDGCTSLTEIVIPDGAETIGAYAFSGCTHLTSVVIGVGVREIGEGAFLECSRLSDFSYRGTEAEWEEIDVKGELFSDDVEISFYSGTEDEA